MEDELIERIEPLLIDGYQNLVKISIPHDPHHLFHAICRAFFKPYIDQEFNGSKILRLQIVLNLRRELADKLSQVIPNQKVRYYDLYRHESMSMLQMQSQLASNDAITFGYFKYLSHQINKDIFILDENGHRYTCSELTPRGRTAIVLYYHDNHFDLVGLKVDDLIQTHFRPTHDLIQRLVSTI